MILSPSDKISATVSKNAVRIISVVSGNITNPFSFSTLSIIRLTIPGLIISSFNLFFPPILQMKSLFLIPRYIVA
nr:MAG TPA: hypothetical protein [Bacteriophage sp.]